MSAYDWHRDYKVGQKWRLRDGIETITVISIHDDGSMTAQFNERFDSSGNKKTDTWDSQGWFVDYWNPNDKDITGSPF